LDIGTASFLVERPKKASNSSSEAEPQIREERLLEWGVVQMRNAWDKLRLPVRLPARTQTGAWLMICAAGE